jgi:hypothetical protein
MKVVRSFISIASALLVLGLFGPGIAQQPAAPAAPAKPAPLPQKRRPTTVAPAKPVIIETVPNAPQVVTLLHRLSGLKMFRLLVRSGEARAIGRLDDEFRFDGQVHTNVIAGLALDDGQTRPSRHSLLRKLARLARHRNPEQASNGGFVSLKRRI